MIPYVHYTPPPTRELLTTLRRELNQTLDLPYSRDQMVSFRDKVRPYFLVDDAALYFRRGCYFQSFFRRLLNTPSDIDRFRKVVALSEVMKELNIDYTRYGKDPEYFWIPVAKSIALFESVRSHPESRASESQFSEGLALLKKIGGPKQIEKLCRASAKDRFIGAPLRELLTRYSKKEPTQSDLISAEMMEILHLLEEETKEKDPMTQALRLLRLAVDLIKKRKRLDVSAAIFLRGCYLFQDSGGTKRAQQLVPQLGEDPLLGNMLKAYLQRSPRLKDLRGLLDYPTWSPQEDIERFKERTHPIRRSIDLFEYAEQFQEIKEEIAETMNDFGFLILFRSEGVDRVNRLIEEGEKTQFLGHDPEVVQRLRNLQKTLTWTKEAEELS